ncbi:acetyl-CoA carboxylase biotin carboxylase subunit family protein [Streptomyces sp. NPDC048436]|uniref:ATP-grasp domain-containing protein n=1 Tax=Streptomyces sp. NPDC048436 TaxID=3365550 RepID=UPI0037237D04
MSTADTRQTVLVVTGYDLDAVPVVDWLADRYRILLIAFRDAAGQRHGGLARAVDSCAAWAWIDDAFNNWETFEQARGWHAQHHIDHVVCLDEFGLIAAAQLRRVLGVRSGQQLDSALSYRLKPRMYEAVADRVRVPRWRSAATAFEVLQAVDDLELPLVIKPVDGAASVDTHVLHTRQDLDAWLRARPWSWPAPLIVQRFIAGRMYHVDGLTLNGITHAATVSAYGSHPGAHRTDRYLTSAMLDPDEPLHAVLLDQVGRALASLPDTGGSSFHAEFFVTPGGEVYFCEIAGRTGGSGIRKAHERATGIHLVRAHALLQCGLPLQEAAPEAEQGTLRRRTGWYIRYAAPGRLLALPTDCGMDGVHDYSVLARPGSISGGATSSVDAVQQFIVEADSDDAFAKTYQAISDWCDDHRISTTPA